MRRRPPETTDPETTKRRPGPEASQQQEPPIGGKRRARPQTGKIKSSARQRPRQPREEINAGHSHEPEKIKSSELFAAPPDRQRLPAGPREAVKAKAAGGQGPRGQGDLLKRRRQIAKRQKAGKNKIILIICGAARQRPPTRRQPRGGRDQRLRNSKNHR